MYTSPFGRLYEPYMDMPDEPDIQRCRCCGDPIMPGEYCWWLSDNEIYCEKCEDAAYDAIAAKHAHEYKCKCEY